MRAAPPMTELAGGMRDSGMAARPARRRRRVSPFWAKQLHLWHWMSSAICLVGMLLFAITGITLNHAGAIEALPAVTTAEATMPPDLQRSLTGRSPAGNAAVPDPVARWAEEALGVRLAGRAAEWSADEVYVALPRPGGDAWVAIDRESGSATYEKTDRGWVSYLNDLHKGRNSGAAWRWFIDIFAAACVVFSLTGFVLLQLHARHRPSTWPLVTAGVIVPVLLLVLFVHA